MKFFSFDEIEVYTGASATSGHQYCNFQALNSACLAVLRDKLGIFVCSSTISFAVVAPLGCAPSTIGPIIPQPIGNTVYIDRSISTTIIQQITVVNNVNIVNIQNNVVNINAITCICCYKSCNNNPDYPVRTFLSLTDVILLV